jgi:hypothetical protein
LELDPKGFWGPILGKGSLLDKVTTKANELLGQNPPPVVPNKNVPITLGDKNTDIAAINATAAQAAKEVGRAEAESLGLGTEGPGGPSYSGPPSLSSPGGTGSGGGDAAAPGSTPDDGYGIFASGGTVTKSKAKNKNSFMSMKGK